MSVRTVRYSHKTIMGGIGLTLGPSGLRFTKDPNSFNRCIASRLRGEKGGGLKGVRERFSSAAKAC